MAAGSRTSWTQFASFWASRILRRSVSETCQSLYTSKGRLEWRRPAWQLSSTMRTSRTALWGILIFESFSTVLIYCQCLPFMWTTAWVLHRNPQGRNDNNISYKTSALFLSAIFLRYEMHDKIIITRQIVIGGRNRYLLNSHNVQQNQIQNLLLGYHYDCQTNTRAREWAFDVSWHDVSTCFGSGFIRCRWMWTIPISWSCRAGSPRSSTWSRRKLWVWLKRQQAPACMRTRKPWPSRPWKRSKTRQCKWEMGEERWDWVQTGDDLSCAFLGHPQLGPYEGF